jgi:hypothetical protein
LLASNASIAGRRYFVFTRNRHVEARTAGAVPTELPVIGRGELSLSRLLPALGRLRGS